MSNLKLSSVLKRSGGTVQGEVSGSGLPSRWGLSGREMPGGELSIWRYCPGESCLG